MATKYLRKRQFHSGSTSIARGLLGGITSRTTNHSANFNRILPAAMQKLVEEGLFVPDGDTYKITVLGLKKLKDLT